MTPAVFLDRDGTLIEQVHHLVDPADVRVVEGAGKAIRQLQANGYRCVVVTNQSVVGRGLLSEDGLGEVHEEMAAQLRSAGVRLDGLYYCPAVPGGDDPFSPGHPERKPAPGMLLRAAAEMALALPESWMVGDSLSDLLAGRNAGCRGSVLVRSGGGNRIALDRSAPDFVARDLCEAAAWIVSRDGVAPPAGIR